MYETVVDSGLGYRKAFALLPHWALDGKWYWLCWVWVVEEWWGFGIMSSVDTLWFGSDRPTEKQVLNLRGKIK